MRPLLAGFGLGLLTALSAAHPTSQAPEREAQSRIVRQERVAAIQRSWADAAPARREAALVRLRGGAVAGQGAAAPSLTALIDAQRWLEGGPAPIDVGGWEQRLADSLGLSVLPGAFEPIEEGFGVPLTVFVQPLFPTPAAETLAARLVWTSPDGEELGARIEPVDPTYFARGFEMYLRAPAGAPGRWHLTLSLLRGEAEYRGHPVPVDAVPLLGQRLRALGLDVEPQADAARPSALRLDALAAHELQRWVRSGLRSPSLTVGALLDLAEGGASWPADSSGPTPLNLGGEPVGWRLGSYGARRGVLLVPSRRESPADMLAGATGERWAAAAAAAGFELVAASSPMLRLDEEQRSALGLLAELSRARGWSETLLVSVGDSAMLTAAALAADRELLPAGLVLLHQGPLLAQADPRLDLPVLSVEPGSPQAGGEELRPAGPPWRRVQRSEPRFLVELELPELIAGWLSALGEQPAGLDPSAGER